MNKRNGFSAAAPVNTKIIQVGCHDRMPGIHLREKPFLVDRFAGPSTIPASRRKGRFSDFLAFSNSYRTILPAEIRTVIFLLICLRCNASPAPQWLTSTGRFDNVLICDAPGMPIFLCTAAVCQPGWPIA